MAAPTLQSPPRTPQPAELRISDFEHVVQVLPAWEGRVEQLSCGRFKGTLRVGRGQQLQVHLATANQAIMVRGRERPGVFTITLVLPESAGCVWQGKRLDEGCLVARGGDVEVDHRSSKLAVNLSVAIAEDSLYQTARVLNRTDPRPIRWLALRPPPEVFGRLEERVRQFLVASSESRAPDAHEAHWFEQACLTAITEAVFPRPDFRKIDLPFRSRVGLVRRAEDLKRARLRVPTGERELCAALGVSGRTLRLAFHERFGLGPMAYFQTIRLHAARVMFKTGDSENIPIAKVAQELGFFHLGKFAGYYHRLFGELPSETCSLS